MKGERERRFTIERSQSRQAVSQVTVLGARRTPLGDLYHHFLTLPWWVALTGIVVTFLLLNVIFAGLYLMTGGIAHARPHSLADAFFFSVQTMGTIGYGAMYPESRLANIVVVVEAICSLLLTAIGTGLIFAKVSVSNARVVFSREVVIAPMDGVPTLMLRVGNERGNQIAEAQLHVALLRTELTREGMTFYRMIDLALVRERSPAFTRSWTAMHVIDEHSPLYRATPESLRRCEAELIVTLMGTDDTSLQTVHARHSYTVEQFIWGARHADILSEQPDGQLVLDLRKFHDLTPTAPTPDFPYQHKPGTDHSLRAPEVKPETM